MLDALLVNYIWTGPVLWAIIYISDFTLTMIAAQLLKSGASKHFVFKMYELTPSFQKDVARIKWISPRFCFILVISCFLLVIEWCIMHDKSDDAPWFSDFYRVLLGALFFVEIPVHLRHFRNIATFIYARKSKGIQGKISYAMWLSYSLSAIEITTFTVGYLFVFLLTLNWYFAGGTLTCLVLTLKHWRLSKKHYSDNDMALCADTGIKQ
jgi:hypothetical protein